MNETFLVTEEQLLSWRQSSTDHNVSDNRFNASLSGEINREFESKSLNNFVLFYVYSKEALMLFFIYYYLFFFSWEKLSRFILIYHTGKN